MSLHAREISVSLANQTVLSKVSLLVEEGEWVGVIGPNGAGKSTLLQTMLGLQQVTDGNISVDGVAITDFSRKELAKRLAFVPQRLHQTPPFSVEELILQGRFPHQGEGIFEKKEDWQQAQEVMHLLNIFKLRSRTLDSVSGGEAQRALIAAAMLQKPKYLVLDEPTSALDLPFAVSLLETIKLIAKKDSMGVLFATHDLNLASIFCDRLILLENGHVIEQGVSADVLNSHSLRRLYPTGWLPIKHPEQGCPQWLPAPCIRPLGIRPAVKKPTKREEGGMMSKERDAGAPYHRNSVTPIEKHCIPSKPSAVGDILLPNSLAQNREEEGQLFNSKIIIEEKLILESDPPKTLTFNRWFFSLLKWVILFFVVLAVSPLFGSSKIDAFVALREGPDGLSTDALIFWHLRLPRVLLAALSGAGLAISGAAFQALLRNPLATPYTLGVAGGASLGATAVIALGWSFNAGVLSSISLASATGALISVGLVQTLAKTLGSRDTSGLLLAGITFSIISSAGVLLLQSLSNPSEMAASLRWLIGSLEVVGWREVLQVLPWVAGGGSVLLWHAHPLNFLAVDSNLATSRGINTTRVQQYVFLAASLSVGGIISQVGPIGFVGLIIPHMMRQIVGEDLRMVLPSSIFAGAVFLMAADTLARVVIAPVELPVGVVTALIGGPSLIFVLFRKKQNY